ncbi:heme binding [Ceratobasidium sp. 370]|nr:heme binding [Ceratobasidium sp. 370]
MSVILETNMGEITLELYWNHAPKTCNNFSELAKRGYYNGVIFHRVIADFMVQGGDPTGTGRGGTSIYGQKFEDEIHPELRFVGAGILAMANSGPNTNGSQFFLTLAPTPYLDTKHTIFGRVSSGMRVVQRLGAVATDAQDSGLGPDTDSELSSAPPSRPSSPVPAPTLVIPNPPPPIRRKAAQIAASPLPKKATASLSKKRTYQQRKRSIAKPEPGPPSEETPASSESEEPRRKPRKRRAPAPKPSADASAAPDATPKRGGRRPRASLAKSPALPQPKPPVITALQQETRPASFLTKVFPVALQPSISLENNRPRADVWSYIELDGLIWVRLDVGGSDVIVAGPDLTEGSLCWWPGQVTQRTPNVLKITLCGAPPNGTTTLELLPSSLSESNILTFRRASTSTVRFPAFNNAYTPLSSADPSASSSSTKDEKLEQLWKTACTRAFEIDTESNDGLEDICLLFSQKTKSTRDDSTQGSAEHVEAADEDDGNRTDECDVIENDTVVLCRYRTRYYPAKVYAYYPRGERGPRGKYLCKFADDSTRIATRHEIHTQLDPGFATCPLGDYQKWESDSPPESWAGRPPTPEPRASSPEPEPESTIDTAEYCARERMRDQLRPLLPFLQGIISRTYVPYQGVKKDGEEEGEELLDRHAAYMQAGRARKSLAYSVHTGDLNEDDCTPEYEQLTPAERLGYISDVLYPEAAALIISYRRGIRTHVGPVSDPQAELQLYTAGIQAAKNTASKEDWVDKILATRQLREAAALKNGPNEGVAQVIVPGGTRSRPKYMLSKAASMLR